MPLARAGRFEDPDRLGTPVPYLACTAADPGASAARGAAVDIVFQPLPSVTPRLQPHRAWTTITGNWIKTWNDDPKPFVWTKIADHILDSSPATAIAWRLTTLIWRVVCQGGLWISRIRVRCVGVCGVGWVGGGPVAVRDAGQPDIRGSGWPQDHGSSWGAAVYGIERGPGDRVAHRHIADSPRVPGRHRPSRPRYVLVGSFVIRFG